MRSGPGAATATAHGPADDEGTRSESARAPVGGAGLGTAGWLALDRLVHAGRIRLPRMVELMSVNPARILKVTGGTLSEGAPADITIYDYDGLKVLPDDFAHDLPVGVWRVRHRCVG